MSTPEAARRIHNGRGLSRWYDPEAGEDVAGWPEVAYESIRAINHLTFGEAMPAPMVYDVLGNLKGVGHMLTQTLEQLGSGLERSLGEFNVYDNSGRTPQESVVQARSYLQDAVTVAAQLGDLLESAQIAINAQGYQDEE